MYNTISSLEKNLYALKKFIIYATVFLFPIFFLPITQEFYLTNKFYLIVFSAAVLVLISTLELIFSKKMVWRKSNLDAPLLLFVAAVFLSLFIISPNKWEAMFNKNFGPMEIGSLVVLSYYISRFAKKEKVLQMLNLSSVFVSLSLIIFFFQPLKSVNLPQNLSFLKTPLFNPLDGIVSVSIFLGFVVLYNLILSGEEKEREVVFRKHFDRLFISILALVALLLGLYSVFGANKLSLLLPPWSVSWYAAIEILKRPLAAIFGVGLDNFASIFSRVKDAAYNQSNLWRVSSFNLSASAILQVLTETGIFGLFSFVWLVINKWSGIKDKTWMRTLFIYILLVLLLLPISIVSLFLFFVVLSIDEKKGEEKEANLQDFVPVYVFTGILGVVVVGGILYFTGKDYLAEIYFKRALDGAVANNMKTLYDNEKRAIILAPYIERFRIDFSQTNLLIANNIAAKGRKQAQKKGNKLSTQDRQTMAQAIQAAITEAKSAVALNPNKASNWANLAQVYRNVLNVVQGADVWTISAYQRAIVEDPQNPLYRISLGGVYFALGKWDEAARVFEQTVYVKPDWANAHYNLAWAYFKKGEYQKAAGEMQTTVNLIDPKKDKADYEKAKKDLEEFKKKLPKTQKNQQSQQNIGKPKELSIPTPPVATISPKIKLPKEASPGAVVNK